MLTIEGIRENNAQCLKDYRAYLKSNALPYAQEKKLIDEINRLQAQNAKIFYLTKVEKKQIIEEYYFEIQSSLNYESRTQL